MAPSPTRAKLPSTQDTEPWCRWQRRVEQYPSIGKELFRIGKTSYGSDSLAEDSTAAFSALIAP